MRAIMTGGGTGGHIYPALAIADKIREMEPDAEILYIGNEDGLEKEIVTRAGYPLELVSARWLDREHITELIKTGVGVMKGERQSLHIIRRFQPDVVIGTGGYVCVPVLLAARRESVDIYLHEQNAYPGVANRALERYAKHIFLGFSAARPYFHDQEKLVDAGNPVRRSFFTLTREEARRALGLPDDAFIVLSFGGSLGAERLNEAVFSLMETLHGRRDILLIFGTGKWYYESILERATQKGLYPDARVLIKDYIDPMEQYLTACDMVISRAGALSVAETTVCGKPAVFVPSPNVTGNHQYYNAKAIADQGGAILLEDSELSGEALAQHVLRLAGDPALLKDMSERSRACAPDRALDIIYETIRRDRVEEAAGRKDGGKD